MDEYTKDIVEDLRDSIAERSGLHPVNRYVTCSIQGMTAVLNELDSLTVRLNEQGSKLATSEKDCDEQSEEILELRSRLEEAAKIIEREWLGCETTLGERFERMNRWLDAYRGRVVETQRTGCDGKHGPPDCNDKFCWRGPIMNA